MNFRLARIGEKFLMCHEYRLNKVVMLVKLRSAVGPKRKKEPKLFPGNNLGSKDQKDFLRLPKIT